MQSILFIGSDVEVRNNKLDTWVAEQGIVGSDVYRISNNDSVKISQIRSLTSYLYKKPLSSTHRVAVVYEAEKLTIPAQNAFLKLLEEPPKTAYILLGARNKLALLPTIVSRCLVINIPITKHELKYKDEIDKLLENTEIQTIFENAEKFGKNKETAEEYLRELLFYLQDNFLTGGGVDLDKHANLAKQANLGLRMLSVNVNPRQILENLFL